MADRPNNLQYMKTHEWLRIEGDRVAVDIAGFAQFGTAVTFDKAPISRFPAILIRNAATMRPTVFS